jgi:acetolactate synthase small subunit
MTGDDHLERELALLRLRVKAPQREAVRAIAAAAGGRILAEERDCLIVELVSSEAAISDLTRELAAQGELLEIVRSGALAMLRQEPTLHVVEG